MRGRKLLVFASLFALMFGFSTSWRMQAQDKSAPSTTMASIDPYLMDRDAEIAMYRAKRRGRARSGRCSAWHSSSSPS